MGELHKKSPDARKWSSRQGSGCGSRPDQNRRGPSSLQHLLRPRPRGKYHFTRTDEEIGGGTKTVRQGNRSWGRTRSPLPLITGLPRSFQVRKSRTKKAAKRLTA